MYDETIPLLTPPPEATSCRSQTTTSSSASAIRAQKKRAKAEAAKARLSFARQEAELKIQLELLQKEREVAAIEAEAAYFETVSETSLKRELSPILPSNIVNKHEETHKYVASLNSSPLERKEPEKQSTATGQMCQDISRYFTRKDILKDRLYTFNGQVEHYYAWKQTFISVISEIQALEVEELDLLMKFCGPGAVQVRSIKTSNVFNPREGLRKAWERLDSQYGAPEKIEQALRNKLNRVTRMNYKDKHKLYELSDILAEILSIKEQPQFTALLAYLDTAPGINPTVAKLPLGLQNKWRDQAIFYKQQNNVLFPPFSFFAKFVSDTAKLCNDPSFDFGIMQRDGNKENPISVAKTDAIDVPVTDRDLQCFLHNGSHSLNDCRVFRHKTLEERKHLLKSQGVCFSCCNGKHLAKDCTKSLKCSECESTRHPTAMHVFKTSNYRLGENHGGELDYNSKCTEVCTNAFGKSCAKIVLVNVSNHNDPDTPPMKVYAIIDDQSNYSLGKPELFDHFNVGTVPTRYSLKSCGGSLVLQGRRASGFEISSVDGLEHMSLPVLTECDYIPNNKNEIPTPSVARQYPHLESIASDLPPLDNKADILLLIGRDLMAAHHVLDQKLGDEIQPFAQRLRLGWVIVGECCLDGAHVPRMVNCMKTYLHSDGRPSIFEPCENALDTKALFQITSQDNCIGSSHQEKCFNRLMSDNMKRNPEGNWEAPLPFKDNRPKLPNNRLYALKRTTNFVTSLSKNPEKRRHTLDFMQSLFECGHAEKAPSLDSHEEFWYLPLFGVYHPQKRDKIRIVFDSSAKFGGVSLNDVLLTGPNLTNNLLGVLMRFRTGPIAVMADIQQMFFSFSVVSKHRNYLRFIWPEDNDMDKPMVDYRMCVHVFGNSPSPAIANYGLQKTAELSTAKFGSDVATYVNRNFYVDDALSSHNTSDNAISLVKRTQTALQENGKLRLHKICSNSQQVLAAFDKEDLAKDLRDLDLDGDFPQQRSLGVSWNVKPDTFTFNVNSDKNDFTRRGVLSTINGLFDPIGFAAAFTITGKLLLRESMSNGLDWDDELPHEFLGRWKSWKKSISELKEIQIPRAYCDFKGSKLTSKSLCVYSDASSKAVAAVAYMVSEDESNKKQCSFVLGKAKVAPKHGHSIPRLELCAAVLAVEIFQICRDELDISFDSVQFFTDSKVVLGYIFNETRRFHIYVGNRIDRIRSATRPEQWNYIPSSLNPADEGTQGITAENLKGSLWLNGPRDALFKNIKNEVPSLQKRAFTFPLVLPEEDREIRSLVTTSSPIHQLGCERFKRFSSWTSVIRSVALLKKHLQTFSGTQLNDKSIDHDSQTVIVRALQSEFFQRDISALENGSPLPKDSRIRNLSPYIDAKGLIRVGGRLKNAKLAKDVANPIIIPQHHLGKLIIRHFHEKTYHQGRHITEGAIRNAGFWLIGCKRQVSDYIHGCFQCKKFRAQPVNPKMSDLPFDRLEPLPPFTNIGIDVFGPWQITTRKTRGGQANSKRWALIFTCLVIRAVHIELLEEMTSSCFINALRRFCALRGEVRIIRSDCGTNFVGSTSDLHANVIRVDDQPVKRFLRETGINWIFNPPHSSHMGGVWERMIGIARRILDNMLAEVKELTHEVLQTLMAEVTSIINARPLVPVSTDPDVPFPLTPSTLLTLKSSQTVDSFNVNDFNRKDLFRDQWKCVQYLAKEFWSKFKRDYLPTIQMRRKWQNSQINFENGDIVLLNEKAAHRNDWQMGVVVSTHNSNDNSVRSVDIRVGKDRKIYTRPVSELTMLIRNPNC